MNNWLLKKLARRILKLRRYRIVAHIREEGEPESEGSEMLNLPGFLYLTEYGEAFIQAYLTPGDRYYLLDRVGGRLDLAVDCWIEPDPEDGR